jgi:hypothetical protein
LQAWLHAARVFRLRPAMANLQWLCPANLRGTCRQAPAMRGQARRLSRCGGPMDEQRTSAANKEIGK